jgi:alpha-1,2-mannosyltransferase
MWSPPNHIDPFTNRVTAWSLGTRGTFILDDHVHLTDPDYYGNLAWIVPTDEGGDRAASQYPPGAALLAAPLYAVWPDDARLQSLSGLNRPDVAPVELLIPPIAPAAITASLAVAVAIGLLGLAFRRLTDAPGVALAGAYVAGLGTSAWSVAADRLWQHGPAMLWIALALVLTTRHVVGSGFAWGAAVLTRPPIAVIAAATGLYRGWKERSIRPAILTGIGALVGVGLFLAYNQAVFGSFSISAGYGTTFQDRALDGDLTGYAKNVFLGVFSASRGFLIWSPFLVVLIPGLPPAWRAAPSWVRGSAIGGLLYLLIQYKANRFSGGSGFYSYRYPLETLTAAAPLLFLSFKEWVAPRPRASRVFVALAIASVVIHAVGAVL